MYHILELKVYFSLSEYTQTRDLLRFSAVHKASPCKLWAQAQENVQIFITKQQHYNTLSHQKVHYSRAKPVF